LLVGGEDQENTQIEKKMKFNETVTASSSSGASNVQIEKKKKFNETVACNFWYLFFEFNQL
jgi:hypothetical protein